MKNATMEFFQLNFNNEFQIMNFNNNHVYLNNWPNIRKFLSNNEISSNATNAKMQLIIIGQQTKLILAMSFLYALLKDLSQMNN